MSMKNFGSAGLLAAAVVLLLASEATAGTQGGPVTADDVLKKVEEQYAGVKDFTVTLDVVAAMERMKVPPMHATMYYKAPDKMHFDAKGFAFLPREGMGMAFGKIGSRYRAADMKKESVEGVEKYKLLLTPKVEASRASTIFLYVDPLHWTAERVETNSFGGRSMVIAIRHELADGFWLPSNLTVTFASTGADTMEATPFDQGAPVPPRQSFRSGTITIRYSDYRVNTGLSDDLFKKEAEPPKR